MKKKYYAYIFVLALIIIIFSCIYFIFYKPKNNNSPYAESSLSLDKLYENKITNYVNQKIILKSKIDWDYTNVGYRDPIDDMPIRTNEIDGLTRPTLVFDNIRDYIPLGKEDIFSKIANIGIVSDKFVNEDNETYSYEGKLLSKDRKYYYLEGTIRYSSRLNLTEDKLKSPGFIEESNNPAYWTQKFEFELIDIKD